MRFRRGAQLDPGQVSDRRGMRGPAALGGGAGLVGLIALLISVLGGGDASQLVLGGSDAENPDSDLAQECRTGEDANQRDDCRIVGVVNSVQAYWTEHLRGYREAPTVFFTDATSTSCGHATSAVGPFYCPLDSTIYIDLGFYDDLRTRFGASGGPFAQAYVIAHEYGHHVQHLTKVLERGQSGDTGPQGSAVRVELMADCLAGRWTRGAVDTDYIEELTETDIRDGLDAAAAVGDNRIQERLQGRVEPETWTHGSSEQRQRWFLTGYRGESMEACDTFTTATV